MRILSYYLPLAPLRLVYMLQQVEYDSFKFADWVDGLPNLGKVQRRQQLDKTARAKISLVVAYSLWAIPLLAGSFRYIIDGSPLWLLLGLFTPLFCVTGLFLFNGFFGKLIVEPTQARDIKAAKRKLRKMTALRIAILGSYGKTTMKDVLATVLAEDKKVAVTPGNKNVLISHARWLLDAVAGDEDVLIFEYGEAEPGDIGRLAAFSQPESAVITGISPAHMDGYGNLDAIASDFSTIYKIANPESVFINADSPELSVRLKQGISYTHKEVDGWKIAAIVVSLDGVSFEMRKAKQHLKLKSGLMGKHNVGPLAAVVAIAARIGLTDAQITAGMAKTKPFEHRLQPYSLGGATIIDDTYNGNLEGMKVGLELLASLPAKRKIFVTPGLVEQGADSSNIHKQLGSYIAQANPNKVVLMQNSTTAAIKSGLEQQKYQGEVVVEPEPLDFYQNLQHFVASGDVVLLQNDWTDNYQ